MENTRHILRQVLWLTAIMCISIGLSGCIEELRFENQDNDSIFVLDGRITPDKATVKLSTTTFNNLIEEPVTGAVVRIVSEFGDFLFLTETKTGFYEEETGAFDVRPGVAYHVEARLSENRVYRSEPDTLPLALAEDDISWQLGSDRGRDVIVVFSNPSYPDTVGPLYTFWGFTDAFVQTPTDFPDPFNSIPPNCYIERRPDLQAVTSLSGERYMGRQAGNLAVGKLFIDAFYDEKHVISVEQYSITKGAFEYWQLVGRLLEQDGSLFDPPPGLLRGNVSRVGVPSEPVRGYVTMAQFSVSRFAIYPSDLPGVFIDPCKFDPSRNWGHYPRGCLNCLNLNGASYIAPDYFFQVR